MKRVFTAAELSILRDFPQTSLYYLAVHKPRVVFRGVLNAVPTTYPGNSLSAVNSQNGTNFTDIQQGMTLYIGSEGTKSDYGTLRVRQQYSGSSRIEVSAFGSGLINFQSGASLTVVEDYRIWPIHPAYNTALSRWRVDELAYNNQTKKYGPQAIMGPTMIGWMDGTQMLASYVGNLSFSHTPGVSINAVNWTFADGQIVTSALGSSATPIVVTYLNASPNGRYTSLTVTDSDGVTHSGQRLTFAFGSGVNAPIDCRFEQITGGLKTGGYRTKIYIDENAPSGTIVDGAHVFIFEKSSYGSVGSSVGGNYFGRDNLVLAGRVVADSQRIEPFTQSLSFDMESEEGELKRAQGYDVFLESGSAASDWTMASGLTIDRAAIVLAKYRSTIANVMDFNIAGGIATTNEIPFRDLPAGYLWDELKYNYAAEMGMVAVDMQGSLWAMLDSQATGLSANLSNVMSINKADRRDVVTIDHPHRDVNSQTRLYAVQGGVNLPIGSESPGARIGYFGTRQEVSQNLTAPNQDTLITWAGNVRARDNNPYNNINIPLAGNLRIDPVPQSYVTMSLSATENPRGISWSNKKIIPHDITLTYSGDNRYATSEIVAETIVNGIGGSSITFPTATSSITPPPQPIPCPAGYHPDSNGICVRDTSGGGDLVYVWNALDVGRTRNFTAGANANYTKITGSINPGIQGSILDPYDPKNSAYTLTTTILWKTSNLDSGATWTNVLNSSAVASALGFTGVTFNVLCGSITNPQGTIYIGWVGSTLSGDLFFRFGTSVTRDGGNTWTHTAFGATGDISTCFYQPFVRRIIGGFASGGEVYIATDALNGSCAFFSGIWKSTNYGATFSQLYGGSNSWNEADFDIDFPSSNTTFVNLQRPGGVQADWSHDGGATFTAGPSLLGSGTSQSARLMINVATSNKSDIMVMTNPHYVDDIYARFYRSTDGGVSYTLIAARDYGTRLVQAGDIYPAVAIGRWPSDSNRVYWLSHGIGNDDFGGGINYSTDGCVTQINCLGDWASSVGAWANPRNIIPCWTA